MYVEPATREASCGHPRLEDDYYCQQHTKRDKAEEAPAEQGDPKPAEQGDPAPAEGGSRETDTSNTTNEQPAAQTKGEQEMANELYQRVGERLQALGQRVILFGQALKKLGDDLGGDGWGRVKVVGPINDIAPQIEEAGRALMEAAAEILEKGRRVHDEWEQHDHVPDAAVHY